MERTAYDRASWRELPRDGDCAVAFLLGGVVGSCHGLMHRHHVDPDDPDSRSFQVCAGHHPRLQSLLRSLDRGPRRRRCPHPHRTPEAREACERRLNRAA